MNRPPIIPSIAALLVAVFAAAFAPQALAQTSDIAVSKSGPALAAPDTDVPYTVSVVNMGPDDAPTTNLMDTTPSGMTFVSVTQNAGPAFACVDPGAGSAGTVSCSIANFVAGSSATFTIVFHIDPATPPGSAFTNIASANSGNFDPNSKNDAAPATTFTPAAPQADMFVSKQGPQNAGPDTDVVYTIVVGNAAAVDATNVMLLETLPGTMTFVSLAQSGTPLVCTMPAPGSGGNVTCSAATYAGGTSTTLTLTGHVPPGTPSGTVFSNSADVSSDNDSNGENNSATFIFSVSALDLSMTKTGPAAATGGSTISYTLTIANAGPDLAIGAVLTDVLPPATTFVSLTQNTGPSASCTMPAAGQGGTVRCTLSNFASGASAQFTLMVRLGNTTSVTNTATASSSQFDTNSSNDSSSVTTTVTPSADLAVTKSGPSGAVAGGTITYTITLTNNGPTDASAVVLTDATPANTTFVSENQTSGPTFACTKPAVGASGTIVCNIATFAPGAAASFSVMLNVSPAAPNGTVISNTATVTSTSADPTPANNSSTTNATVLASSDLALTKTGPSNATAGSNIAYTITATNNGPSASSAVTLSDALPPNTSFVSLSQTSGPGFACTTPPVGAGGTVTCTIASLAVGATATFSLVLSISPAAGGTIVNSASISANSDPNGANNASSAVTALAIATIPALTPLALMLMILALLALTARSWKKEDSKA